MGTIIVSLELYLLCITVVFYKSIIQILTVDVISYRSIFLTAKLVLRTTFQTLSINFLIFNKLIFLLIIEILIFFIEWHCRLIFLNDSLFLNLFIIFSLFFARH